MGKQSQAIGASLRVASAAIVKATVLEIDANLRRSPVRGGTPVDTGHARANWVPSVGTESVVEVPGADASAHDAGVAAVLAYTLDKGPAFVSNHVPYIERLNYGYSQQAPAMFIERCVEEALATMQKQYGNAAASVADYRNELGGEMAGNLADAYSPFGG